MSRRARLAHVVIRKRIATLLFSVAIVALLLSSRLAYVQIAQHGHFTELALEQRLRAVPADPLRGTIYDRHMLELAISVSSDAIYVRPVEIKQKESTARTLAELLDLSYDDVLNRVQTRQAEVWIKRRADADEAARVRDARLPGVYLAQRTARSYPYGSLAAHVLGLVGIDNQGLEGIELFYDDVLKGTPGRALSERDARGRSIPIGAVDYVPPLDGYGLILTIDAAIQKIAERELERACIATLSEFCMTLWMDPKTGHILAMATYPGFDANAPGEYPPEARRNRIVTDQFEPGSTFKIVTSTVAMEEGVVTPEEGFFDPGFILIGGGRVNCWRGGGHGSLTFAEAVEHSCNPVFAELGGTRLGPDVFHPYLRAFGFGDRLGIDYPGEAKGQIPPKEMLYGETLQWANVGFGQGVAVSSLQLVSSLATIANFGVRMQPMLVQATVDPRTGVVRQLPRQPVQRVLSQTTSETFLQMMRTTVETGSGTNADVPGYRIGGKTGTAQVAEGGVYTDKRLASFIGVAPTDDPQLVGMVALYDLQPRPAYGGVHAAPVFQAIAAEVLPLLGVEKRLDPEEEPPEAGNVRVPNVQNLPRNEAEAILRAANLNPVVSGLGTYVLDQTPAPGAEVPGGTRVVLDFWETPEHWQGETTIPGVTGLNVREAAQRLADAGLVLDMDGMGIAATQQPEAGQRVLRGTKVKVTFE